MIRVTNLNERPWVSTAQLLRSGLYGVLSAALLTIVTGFALVSVLSVFDLRLFKHAVRIPALSNVALHLLELAAILFSLSYGFLRGAGSVFGYRFAQWLTVVHRVRYQLVLAGVGAGLLTTGIMLLSERWILGKSMGLVILDHSHSSTVKLTYALAAIVSFSIIAIAEESFFRGYLFRVIAAGTQNISFAILVSSLIFSAYHLDFDLFTFLGRMLAGIAFAWSVVRIGGLEFAIGSHAAGNITLALFTSPLDVHAEASAQPLDLGFVLINALTLVGVTEMVRRSSVARVP